MTLGVTNEPVRELLFPLLAMLLSNGTIGDALMTELEATGKIR